LRIGHWGSMGRIVGTQSLMSEMGQTEKNSVRAHVFRFALELGHCSTQSACLKRATSGLSRYKKSRRTNGDILVVPASNIMRILLLVFQATPKSHQDDTVFRSVVAGGYSLVGRSIKPAKPKPARPNVARLIDLMFPISFKSLLKYLRRCSLVNFSKLLERKRVGHTQNIGINGL
jgi:hypothetical protein